MLIVGGNQLAGGYEVANSLRFDDGSSDYLSRTPASAGNRRTFTISVWVKRGDLGRQQHFAYASGSTEIRFSSADKTTFRDGGGNYGVSDAVFRDVSAWYHIVYAIDTTQATSSNRIKLYVNGKQFTVTTFPTQNFDFSWNNNVEHQIGASNGTEFFDGYMAEFVNIDGQQLDPTSFGEFDTDSGIWKPKAVSGLTFGTNGFYLPFENSAALGQDDSGNGNNFTVNNLTSIDQSTDTPTNNFCTMNSLISNATYSDGNLTAAFSSNKSAPGTLGAGSGKWYFETKMTTTANTYLGICSDRNTGPDFDSYRPLTEGIGINNAGNMFDAAGTTGLDGLPGISDGDIIGCAFDVDNGKLWWSKNGQWYTADAAAETTLTIADIEAGNNGYDFSSWTGQFILPYHGTSSVTNDISANFGSPPFTISSGNSDADGYGNFEYPVPSGYYALNTKNLAEYG